MSNSNIYQGNSDQGEIEIETTNPVYSNKYTTLYNDYVLFPNKTKGQYIRFTWNAPYGIHLFVTNNNEEILLLYIFRHELRQWHYEIPKGFGEPNFEPLNCAQKELWEETGYQAINWQLFKQFKQYGITNYIYQCAINDVGKSKEKGTEEYEAIASVNFFSKQECVNLLFDDDMINDPLTLFLITYFINEQFK